MPKVSPIQNNFSGGEFSPLLYARAEVDRYKQALETCENWVTTVQGPATRRPGTYYVGSVKTSNKATRLVSFEFSTTQAYIIEFGDQYCRFYKDGGQILSGGVAYEISTPYLEADLFQLKFAQSGDTLYIVHPSYAPRTLTRSAHTSWTLSAITFSDGPYLPQDASGITIATSGVSGTIVLTTSSPLFTGNDVGRLIRMKHPTTGTWGWVRIFSNINSTQVYADVGSDAFSSIATFTAFKLGVWSIGTGYPSTVTFHEDRLFFGGCTNYPQRIDGSVSGEYTRFSPSDPSGAVSDQYGVSFTMLSDGVHTTRWLASDEKGLCVGTVGGEYVVRPSSQGEALTPTNITAKKVSAYGSANVQGVQVGRSTIYAQRGGNKIREFSYFDDVGGHRSVDLTVLANHIAEGGVLQFAYQKIPYSIVWAVRADGQLLGMTFDRDEERLSAGWHRHVLGGVSSASGNDAIVESAAVIPNSDGTADELWLVVRRRINGATTRYIEYLMPFFDESSEIKDAFFVDCGLSYDSPKTITGATKANPVVVTSNSHGFSNGDEVLITGVSGMTELNGNTYTVANKTANTFELQQNGANVNGTSYTTYITGGEVRKYVQTMSGLSHLEGQTVAILGDGSVQPSKTVSGGSVTLATKATTVHIGLPYNSDLKLLRMDAGAMDGTSLGKTQRMHRVGVYLYRSVGLQMGPSFDDLTDIIFRTAADPMSRAIPLYTGVKSETFGANYDMENRICIRQSEPLPSTILAVMPQLMTQDRA